MAQYGTIITNIGLAQIANAQITQTKVGLEYIALGDGNGAHYVPTQSQTALVHEVWRGPIAELSIDPTNSNRIIIDAVIPVTAGGFTIREIGIFDDKNNLIAIGQYPEKYKPQLSEGVSEETIIHFVIETNNVDVVKLTIDPTVIIASRNYVDGKVAQVQTALTEHLAESNINAHKIGNIDGLQTALEEIADSQMTVNGKAIEYNGDYNLLRKSGWYNGSQSWGAKNLPPTGPASYLVEVIAWSGYNEGSVTQFARSSNKPEVTWFRQGFANGNWNPWTRVTDALYNIYVDPVNGVDEDCKGWSDGANAYKTLGYALGKLPRLSGYETTLTLAAGTYSTLNLSNYRGGLLTVRGAGATTVIDWVMFSHIDNLQLRDFNAVMGLDLRVVNNFSIQNVNSPYGTDGHGVYCLASSGMISMSTYSSKTSGAGIKLDNGSNVVLDTVSGSGNKIGIDVELSICRRRASSITGTTPTRALNGGQIL